MKAQARITSKGQVTIPVEVRRYLGLQKGDRLEFQTSRNGVRVRVEKAKKESPFAKYQGIGNPGIPPGREGTIKWLREMRGE